MAASSRNIFNRQRLLQVVRGITKPLHHESSQLSIKKEQNGSTCYKCFPLEARHIEHVSATNPFAPSPHDFHKAICDKIKEAKERVYLASLYIGPAVDKVKYHREAELLECLKKVSSSEHPVDIKILLDLNRALRPVPIADKEHSPYESNEDSITSAEACFRALRQTSDGSTTRTNRDEDRKIYLLSALQSFWQRVLPNPYNEAMGVFHIKVYIVDDSLILSGANLSEEYFVDRHDRYLQVKEGGNGLVDFYADLVKVMCEHAPEYEGDRKGKGYNNTLQFDDFLDSISKVVMTDDCNNPPQVKDLDQEQTEVVAIAVPTFQAPPRFGQSDSLRSDVQTICEMVQETSEQDRSSVLRMASAYLNPTESFLKACDGLQWAHFLTAGYVSHGFKPKKKAGNKGRVWIPAVFHELSRQLSSEKFLVWLYQRESWTFHAKGLWLTIRESLGDKVTHDPPNYAIPDDSDLVAVTHGSGNFGERSEKRDLESNLVLLFPPKSPLADFHQEEWNEMESHAEHFSKGKGVSLSPAFKMALPAIRSFF